MKKIVICTILVAAGAASLLSINNNIVDQTPDFGFKNVYAMTLGYDKTMSDRTIEAAVKDSYFRDIAKGGKIIRWNKSSFPLKVYVQDSPDMPDYYNEIVVSAYKSWQRASEGLVSFEFVEEPSQADLKCYFKSTGYANGVIGTHAFSVNGNKITDSTIIFRKTDDKNRILDSKQLYSSALREIGHSLGLTGKSTSIYDVMYPIGIKFNTEITPRDLKSLALVYSVVPDITDKALTTEEKSQLFSVKEILATLEHPISDNAKLDDIVATDLATHLAKAEKYRIRAEYDKAAREYQAIAQMKTDRRSKSEVYYEVAAMYLDAEEFDKAKNAAEIACATDMNDLTDTLPALIDYYTKQSNNAVEQLEALLKMNPYNKHAYKLLCQIYRDKHHENLLNSTIRRYGKTAGEVE